MKNMKRVITLAATRFGLAVSFAAAPTSTEVVGDVYENYLFCCALDDQPGNPDRALVYVSNISQNIARGAGTLTDVIISGWDGVFAYPPTKPILYGPYTVGPGQASPSVDQGDSLDWVTLTGDFNGKPFAMALPGTPSASVSALPVADEFWGFPGNPNLGGTPGGPGLLIGELEISDPPQVVPEPSTLAMSLLGAAGLGFAAYRRRVKIGSAAMTA